MPTSKLKYVAEVTGREVTLVGDADLEWWRERLAGVGLTPFDNDGHAELCVSAIATRFNGIAFSELVISAQVSQSKGGGARDGVYLAHAFNSSRLFTFFEKYWFKTPYSHADVIVDSEHPSLRIRLGGTPILEAKMSNVREPSSESDDRWEGPIHLPTGSRFYAKLKGHTKVVAYESTDTFRIEQQTVPWLSKSDFRPTYWSLRPTATHARSKTFRS